MTLEVSINIPSLTFAIFKGNLFPTKGKCIPVGYPGMPDGLFPDAGYPAQPYESPNGFLL